MSAILNSLIDDTANTSDKDKIQALIGVGAAIQVFIPGGGPLKPPVVEPTQILSLSAQPDATVIDFLKEYFAKKKIPDFEYSKGDRRLAIQKRFLMYLSEYLIIQLNCFGYIVGTGSFKIPISLDLPLTLDMNPFVDEKNKNGFSHVYALQGVVAHSGNSPQSGHYIAYVNKNNQWYECNDAVISPLPSPRVIGFTPYILVYKRKDMTLENLTNLAESLQELSQGSH
jgi:hypothetical protein